MAARNTKIKVGVKLVNDHAKLPTKGSVEAACYDIYLPDDVYIAPHSTKAVGTGLVFLKVTAWTCICVVV